MPVVGGVGPPRRRVWHDRGPARTCGLDASRGAPTGGVRPRPYAVVASHEAEGWRGARGGGRVRAPAGRRLCLLCQIGDLWVANY